MRDIKFRGLRTDGKGWIYGDLGKMWNGIPFIMPKCFFATKDLGCDEDNPDELQKMLDSKEFALGGFIEVIPETVGQFTGLQDRKGKELYEGDLLKVQDPYNGNWSTDYEKVIFSTNYVGGWVISNGQQNLNLGTRQEYLEIIGNIHENPEL